MTQKPNQPVKNSRVKNLENKAIEKIENNARRVVIEDLFYDLYNSRKRIYMINFFRGIFFGLGSVLGATLIVTIIIWILGQFGSIFPPLADFLNNLIDAMQRQQ